MMQMPEDLVQTMVQRIVERFRPLCIILFGSRARGEAGPWSDVVGTTPEEVLQRGNLVGSVLRSALREGKVLYERA